MSCTKQIEELFERNKSISLKPKDIMDCLYTQNEYITSSQAINGSLKILIKRGFIKKINKHYIKLA